MMHSGDPAIDLDERLDPTHARRTAPEVSIAAAGGHAVSRSAPGARARHILALACLLLTHALGAQEPATPYSAIIAATCGWPPYEADPVPAILTLLNDRLAEQEGYAAETARDGLAQLQRWVRECDATAARQAVLELQRAHDRVSSDPTFQAALGVALAHGVEVQPPGAHGHNYRPAYALSNAERDARRLLTQALEAWPAPELGVELAGLALSTRDDATLKAAAEALEKLTDRWPSDAAVWTARAEVGLARYKYGEAAEAGGKAAALGDGSGFRALGVTRLLRDDDPDQGCEMYLEGLASADEGALYRYHEDIAPLLQLEEEQAWAGLKPEDRSDWLRSQWEWRASTAGRTVAERIALHFERLETAIDRFRRLAHRGARPIEALVWDSLQLRLPYDDRGLIHIRHGEPDDIVRAPSGRVGPGREAWIYYRLADGRAVFEFRKLRDWADYVLAPPAECDPFVYMYGVSGAAGEVRYNRRDSTNSGWQDEFERGVLDYGTRLGAADPGLATHAAFCFTVVRHPSEMRSLATELPYIRLMEAGRRREARAEVAEALATETAAPRFENFILALSSVYMFRGRDGDADVAAFLLMPAHQLTPRPLDQGVAYPLRLSLAVEDPTAHQVQRMDTLITFGSARPLDQPGQHLRTALQMRAHPVSNATVRITVLNPDHPDEGQILVSTKPVPTYPRDGLSMSDLVIAEPQAGSWHRGGVSISPLPGHQLVEGERFRLFYEVYGLGNDDGIRTRIAIAPAAEPGMLSRMRALFGDARVLELSFDESARTGPDGVLQVERTITPSLEPGRYTIEVTVERPSTGDVVKMETKVLFLERRSG